MSKILQCIVVGPLLFGCNTLRSAPDDVTDVKVVNGEATNGFSAVVRITADANGGVCTGTFLNDTTLLTAAHCVVEYHRGNHSYPRIGHVTPVEVLYDQTYFALNPTTTVNPQGIVYDVAIVRYPVGTGAQAGVARYPVVRTTMPSAGTQVTIVGYGSTNLNDNASNAAGVKYMGANTIAESDSGMILITGPCEAVAGGAGRAVAGSGDSGGPMIVGDYEIIGVVSSGACAPQIGGVAIYTALATESSKALLQSALGGGNGGGMTALCGNATQNTAVCINADRTVVTIQSRQTLQTAQYQVQQRSQSQTLIGGIGHVGVANLSFVAGMGPQTGVTFVVHEQEKKGRLFYLTATGWTPWGGGGVFPLTEN